MVVDLFFSLSRFYRYLKIENLSNKEETSIKRFLSLDYFFVLGKLAAAID